VYLAELKKIVADGQRRGYLTVKEHVYAFDASVSTSSGGILTSCVTAVQNGKEDPKGRPPAIRGDREEPASVQAREAEEREGQQEEAREVNPPQK
jgi:hypothetical protein